MEQKPNETQTTNKKITQSTEYKLGLPITALLFNIIPYLLFLVESDVFILIFISIFPFIGFLLGIVALCRGVERIGKHGRIISIIAIAWPVVFVLTTLLFSATGALTMNM